MSHAPPLALRSQEKYRFDHRDMDFYFSWILGRPPSRAATRGSVSRPPSASRMASRRVGRKHGPISPAALNRRAQERCRKAILPARAGPTSAPAPTTRAPLFMTEPANLLFREHWRKMQACFRQAAALFDPPFEAVEVPYQGKTLPGYFCRAGHRSRTEANAHHRGRHRNVC